MSAEITAKPYRDYSVELKAAVIEACENNNGNTLATAKLFNIPQTTVYEWVKHSGRFNEIRKASATNLADRIEHLANKNIDSVEVHDLSTVSYADKVRSLGVLIDKMQLLRGNPTQITENIEHSRVSVALQVALAAALGETVDVDPEPEP